MTDELTSTVYGYDTDPSALIEQVFLQVAQDNMADLPFYQAHLPVKACGFRLFEGQWFGALVTPWMMQLMVLPGPGEQWPRRETGERLGLAFPQGNIAFRAGEIAPDLHYLACSLMSPVQPSLSHEQAIALAENSVTLALSLPVRNVPLVDQQRRALLRGNFSNK